MQAHQVRKRPTWAVAIVLALVAAATAVVVASPSTSAAVTTVAPAADAYVDNGTPATPLGTVSRLVADASPTRQVFLRFDLGAVGGPVQSARLRLHVANTTDAGSPSAGTVAAVTDTGWTEASLTYANRPTSWGTTLATLGAVTRNTWVEVDVTAAVNGTSLHLGLRSTNGDGAYFDSREVAGQAPQLVVTTADTTTTTPTTTPTSTTTSSTTTTTTTTSSSTTTTTAPPTNGTVTVAPVADASVDAGTPSTALGTSTRLQVDASPVRQTFLRFDLSTVTSPLLQARLRLHVANTADSQSPVGGTVASVTDTGWSEPSLTYPTRPTTWGATAAALGPVTRNSWIEVTVTSAVQVGGVVTLGLRSTNGDGAIYDSRETGTNGPRLIVTTGTATPGQSVAAAACTGQLLTSDAGPLADGALNEPSGIEAGVRNPGTYWIHNDSGDTARVFAVSRTGVTQRVYNLGGVTATDIEDVAIGPGPSPATPYLYVADIGDNGTVRTEIRVYRVAEPAVTTGAAVTLSGVETLRLRYPDGARNAEALLVDPLTGQLTVITKNAAGGPATVYVAPANLAGGSLTTLTAAGALALPAGSTHLVTGADLSPDGTQLAVRTYAAVLLWTKPAGATVAATLATPSCSGPVPSEVKGEAIAFHPDGRGYVTVNESLRPVLHGHHAP